MPSKDPKIIKRYHNRKLYDTVDSCYVTLEDISDMIRQGEDVRIIDNTSKEDLTAMTLAQIIFEEQKKKTTMLPMGAFRQIIQSSGEVLKDIVAREFSHVKEFVDDKVKPTVTNIQNIPSVQAELESLKKRVMKIEEFLSRRK